MWQLPGCVQVVAAVQNSLADPQKAENPAQAPALGAFLPSAVDLQALRAGAPKAKSFTGSVDSSCCVSHTLYPLLDHLEESAAAVGL